MKDLTKDNIYKTFLLFAFPLILSGILNQSYSIIDTMIAGKFLGENGLAAIGCSSGFQTMMIIGIFQGYILGSSTLIASLFGAHKYKEIKTLFYSNQLFVALLCMFISLVVLICDDYILSFLQVDPVIYNDAKIYMDIIFLGAFLGRMNSNCLYTLNAFGISSYTFYISLSNAIVNVLGNILSVTILQLGVAGIALSTVFANLVSYILYVCKIRKCFREIGMADYKVRYNIKEIFQTVKHTVPSIIQQSTMHVTSLILSPMVNGLGSSASAAYSIAQKFSNICNSMYTTSSRTLNNYAAQCVGSGKQHLLKKGVQTGLLQSFVFVLPPVLMCSLFAKKICEFFFPSGFSGESLQYSILFAKYYLPFIFLHAINSLFHSFYRGIGCSKLLILLTTTGSISRILFTILLFRPYGIEGVFLAWIFSWLTETIVVGITYFSGVWKKQLGD